MRITLQPVGLDELQRKFAQLGKDITPTMETAMRKAMLYLHGKVPKYPEPPPKSSYRRTGTLGRSITTRVEREGGTVVGFIGTNVEYAQYVIDKDNQAWMHKGRWWTLQGVVNDNKDGVIKILEDAIREALQ